MEVTKEVLGEPIEESFDPEFEVKIDPDSQQENAESANESTENSEETAQDQPENAETNQENDSQPEPEDDSEEDRLAAYEHNLLIKILNAERDCRKKEKLVDAAKSDLSDAKKEYENSVEHLRELASQAAEPELPMFDNSGNAKKPEPEDPFEEIDDSWKEQPITVLWDGNGIKGLGKAKVDSLVDEVGTLGKFQALLENVGKDADHLHRLLPEGCGEALANELEERHVTFVTKYRTDKQVEDQEKILNARLEEIQQSESWKEEITDEEIYHLGFNAFLEDFGMSTCPYLEHCSEMDDWLRGFFAAQDDTEFNEDEVPADSEAEPVTEEVEQSADPIDEAEQLPDEAFQDVPDDLEGNPDEVQPAFLDEMDVGEQDSDPEPEPEPEEDDEIVSLDDL